MTWIKLKVHQEVCALWLFQLCIGITHWTTERELSCVSPKFHTQARTKSRVMGFG